MKLYRKIVTIITAFCGGVTGVFLLSGAGAPGLRVLVLLFFLICLLNASTNIGDFTAWLKKTIQVASGHLATASKPDAKPQDSDKPKDDNAKPAGESGDKKSSSG